MKKIAALAILALTLGATSGCDHAPANVKVMVTNDCGVTWSVIPAGQRVPKSITPCEYRTVLPDYPMQGDTEFQAQFLGNVLVRVKISYDYEIVDGLKFLQEAKFLGKSGSDAKEVSSSTNMAQFETAENMVIDVRLREATTSRTLSHDIVDFNSAKFEDELFVVANKALEERGVKLRSITFVTVPDEQTRMAIDAATAANIYKSKVMVEFGQRMAIAKAGAARIEVNQAK